MALTELFAFDLAATTVTSGGTDAPASGTVQTWTVSSSAMFGAAQTGVSQFHVADVVPSRGGEIIAVTNVSGTTWTVTRGAGGTTPVAHGAGFGVYQVTTAGFLGGITQGALPLAGGTVTGQFSRSAFAWWSLDSFTGTDDQKMTSAIAQVVSAGGGTIEFGARAHAFAGQWSTSYVSSSVTTAIRITGQGVAFNGAWGAPSAATTCTFTYSGAGAACMDFQHNGSIELTGIQFISANAGVPLMQATNATPNVHDCVFSGGGSGTACVTDAILLGGTGSTVGAGDTAPYQGYQGAVYRNFFDGIRRIVVFQTFANSIEVYGNTVSTSCGNGSYLGGCVEFANGNAASTGNHVHSNCVEMVHYPCFIRCTSNAELNTFGPNGLYDATTALTVAYYVFLAASCAFNTVRDGMRTDTIPLMLDLSGNVANEATTFHQSAYSLYPQPPAYYSGSYPPVYMGLSGYAGPVSVDFRGNGAQIAALNDTPSANDSAVQVNAYSCTQVTDGGIYSGSPVVTSLTAAFTTTDVYRPCSYTGSAANAVIVRSVTPATAIRWAASAAYSLGDVTRPATANSHLYQCTTAGTSGASQPAFPTNGSTVTDGTAVWTDLGTSATAVMLSAPSTATSTGVTVSFGRFQAVQLLTKFQRHHIITADGGTPSTGADAGAGSGPSGISTTGSDHSFTVNITSGTGPASGQMFHSNLAQNAGTFRVVMNAGNAAAATLMAGGYWVLVSANSVQVNFTNAPAATTAYIFNFVGMA